jgi:hypothetical protein
MKKKHTPAFAVLLAISLGIFISCEKDIAFKGEVTDPMLVVNSTVNTDSVVSAHISQSRFVLGKVSPIPDVENAAVTLYVNGTVMEKLAHKGKGVYKGSYVPKPSDEIGIEVEAPGFEKLGAKTMMPENVNLSVKSVTETVKENSYPDGNTGEKLIELNIKLTLTDNPEQENYYFIKGRRNAYYQGMLQFSYPLDLKLSDILDNKQVMGGGDAVSGILWEEDDGNRNIKNIFTDLFVNGKELGLNFIFHEPVQTDPDQTIEYEIEVAQMSKDLYLYVISANKAISNNGIPIVEATQVHSNMTNHVGILGAYNSHKMVFTCSRDDSNP